MFNQQKHNFAICKTHTMEGSNRRIPLGTSNMQYRDSRRRLLHGTRVEKDNCEVSIKCNGKTADARFLKAHLNAMEEEF